MKNNEKITKKTKKTKNTNIENCREENIRKIYTI